LKEFDNLIREKLGSLLTNDQLEAGKEFCKKIPTSAYFIAGTGVVIKLYMNYRWNFWTRRGITGPAPSLTKAGNWMELMELIDDRDMFYRWQKEYGNIFGIYMMFQPILFITDREALKEVNIKQFSKFPNRSSRSSLDTVIGKISEDFMTTIHGNQWKRIRSSTTPLMSQAKLTNLLPLIREAACVVVENENEINKNDINTRYCEESASISEEITIEKGTIVCWFNPLFHMDEDYYDQPDKFNPDRWEGNESNTLQDENWFGFGQGPRSCPGTRWAYITMKMYIISILNKYKIISSENTPDEIKMKFVNMKLGSDKPMLIKFQKRNK